MITKHFVLAAVLIAAGTVLAYAGGGAAAGRTQLGDTIIIAHDYIEYDTNTYAPKSAYEEKVLAWRKQIQRENNVTIKQVNFGMDSYTDNLLSSIMAGKPIAQVCYLYNESYPSYYNQGLLFPLDTIAGVDFNASTPVNWNQDIRRFWTFPDGHTYGFTPGYGEERRNIGLFFNKRILRDAGIDPESIYDMQKAGTWTWAALEEMLRKTTKDTDNDGKVDIYGLGNQNLASAHMAANGASYIDKDAKGNIISTLNSPALLEAMAQVQGLFNKGYIMRDGAANMAFKNGMTAFWAGYEGDLADLAGMKDDYGYALFPKGPRATDYRVIERDSVYMIPGTYSAGDAEKIMRLYMLWIQAPPGAVPGEWKTQEYPKYQDARAVDETLAAFRSGKHFMFQYERIVPGMHPYDLEGKVGDLSKTPAQLLEAVSQDWSGKIAEVNRLLQKK
jgi:ABC-type glycerol-3-phosphate transport system substrate-binding protein